MKKFYNINEFYTRAENEDEAMQNYVRRRLKLDGRTITEFKGDNIYEVVLPLFKALANRFDGYVVDTQTISQKVKVPKVILDGYPFGKELSVQIRDDNNSDGFILALVWYGEKDGQCLTQVLEYFHDDLDTMEFEIREATNVIEGMQRFLE